LINTASASAPSMLMPSTPRLRGLMIDDTPSRVYVGKI
jgi:hypothetical protein